MVNIWLTGTAGHTQKSTAGVRTPGRLADTIATDLKQVRGVDISSLPVNFKTVPVADAKASMHLFAETVMAQFSGPEPSVNQFLRMRLIRNNRLKKGGITPL